MYLPAAAAHLPRRHYRHRLSLSFVNYLFVQVELVFTMTTVSRAHSF
jgi:hypothetical protein